MSRDPSTRSRRPWSALLQGCAALAALVLAPAACGTNDGSRPAAETAEKAATPAPPIAKVWRARCGMCHVRVEPGSRSRSVIDAALPRHHKRVRLSDDQWAQLADFLAPPALPPAGAPIDPAPPASTPIDPAPPAAPVTP